MSFSFDKFLSDFLVSLTYSTAEMEFLRQLRFSGGKYSDFANILALNQEVETAFLERTSEAYKDRLQEPISSSEVALSMMGFLPARNFIAASLIKGKSCKLVPGDPAVSQTLYFALMGESLGGENQSLSLDYFGAGLLFDLIFSKLAPSPTTQEDPSQETKKELPPPPDFALELWNHGVQISRIACSLSQELVPQMNLERDLCLEATIHDIGKLIFCLLDPESQPKSQPESQKGTSKGQPVLPDQTWLDETKKYSLPHDAIGHLALWRLGFLGTTTWVTLYHHQPFLAARLGATPHARATLIWLADHIFRYQEYHHASQISDTMLSKWHQVASPSLKKCNAEKFKKAIQSILSKLK